MPASVKGMYGQKPTLSIHPPYVCQEVPREVIFTHSRNGPFDAYHPLFTCPETRVALALFRRRDRFSLRVLASIVVFGWLAIGGHLPAFAQKYDPQHPVVLDMVKRGLDYLSKTPPSSYGEGGTMLAALAIYKADPEATPDHPRIKAGLQQAVEIARSMASNSYQWGHDSMYSVPVAGMLLTSVDPALYSTEIKTIRDVLIGVQRPNGGFGYMIESPYKTAGSGDISQTQYVMLCLWTMSQANIEIAQEPVRRCLQFLASAQKNDGGWAYQAPDPNGQNSSVTNSLTAAGFSGYLIAGDTLGLFRSKWAQNQEEEGIVPTAFQRIDPDEKKKKAAAVDKTQVETVVKRAENWFNTHPYQRSMWHYYYVYSKERYESFLEITKGNKEKSPDWYNEGVDALIAAQDVSGGWGIKGGDVDGSLGPDICTSFAILFLIRSTQKAIGELHDDVLLGGQGLPDDPTSVVVKNGKLMNRTAATNIDDALKMLEDNSKVDGKEGLIPDQMVLPKDPKERKDQLNRFARLMNSRDAATRKFAARLLGRGDDLDFVPSLIYGITDPDAAVARYSEASLRLISRQLDTYHLPRDGEINSNHRTTAVLRWRQWYLTVRPDYVFVD